MDAQPHEFQLGSFKCFAIQDGEMSGTANLLFANADQDALNDALQIHQLDPNHLPTCWIPLLIDTGNQVLLVDTGIGSEVPSGGQLVPQLEQLGYPPNKIDLVFLSHAHADHIGGCVDHEGQLVFPNARHLMSRREFEFWSDGANLADVGEVMRSFAQRVLPLIEPNVVLIDEQDEILPGIRAVEAFGHTPGHLALEAESGGERLLFLADAVLHLLHVEHPEWVSQLDMAAEATTAARRKLFERAIASSAKVLLYHLDFPGLGRIIKKNSRYDWQPL